MNASAAIPTYGLVALDCPDPKRLAEFYAALLEWPKPVGDANDEWLTLTGPGGLRLAFQRVVDYRAPEWPGQDVPQQLHLDFYVADLEAATRRAVELGAKLLDESAETWNVFADPVGHPFCLCRA